MVFWWRGCDLGPAVGGGCGGEISISTLGTAAKKSKAADPVLNGVRVVEVKVLGGKVAREMG